MKIGLDLDGTLDHASEFFSALTRLMYCSNTEIHVITYRDDRKGTEEKLAELGVTYTKLHLPEDTYPEDGLLGADAPTWKAALAEKLDLDVMFEDDLRVLAAMPKKVKTVWVCDRSVFDLLAAERGMRR